MKILIGSVMTGYKEGVIALQIPGIGTIESEPNDNGDNMFCCIKLNEENLLSLQHEINKELYAIKKNSI